MKALALIILVGIAACNEASPKRPLPLNVTVQPETQGDLKTAKISVNKTAVEMIYDDALRFGKLWEDTTRNE